MSATIMKHLSQLGHPKPPVKIVVLTAQGPYRAEVPGGLADHEVNKLIHDATKSRSFRWYVFNNMLELKL